MGRIAKLLSFVRVTRNNAKISDVKIDPGGNPNITSEHYAPPGDDSFPLKSDYVYASRIPRTGGEVITGYLDPINEPVALEGDKRIYSRDPDTGLIIAEVWLKNDGTIISKNANGSNMLRPDGGSILTTPESTFDAAANGSIAGANGSGSFELQAAGDFVVNGVTIDTSGNITTPTSVNATSIKANGKELAGHVHAAGTPPGNTGPNQ